ncbi:hypothetical protein [Cohnella yongneupensis]|uniref:DinB-like domain-containing protein n=1 Tax=Cohnella yongneupensis TaxID=425006 RepID=A0ABW0QT14_9BACL
MYEDQVELTHKESNTNNSLTLEKLIAFSAASDVHLTNAMRELPEEAWGYCRRFPDRSVDASRSVRRTLYHTGLHAGQISLIRKHAPRE